MKNFFILPLKIKLPTYNENKNYYAKENPIMGATDVGETLAESTTPKNMVQAIYQTRRRVFHMQFQTLRSGLKWAEKTRLRRVFFSLQTSRCLDIRSYLIEKNSPLLTVI